MDALRLKAYRQKLLDHRKDLLSRVQAVRSAEAAPAVKGAPDFVDRALESRTREMLYRLGDAERRLVQRIDAALIRMDVGEYGVCANCGKEVQEARLQAVPWALHCVECQELQDRGEI